MRTLQEWMGHRDFTTTRIYADYAPDPADGAAFAERAFGPAHANPLTASGRQPEELSASDPGKADHRKSDL